MALNLEQTVIHLEKLSLLYYQRGHHIAEDMYLAYCRGAALSSLSILCLNESMQRMYRLSLLLYHLAEALDSNDLLLFGSHP